ncbi:hypothetical protein BO70DRAFT_394725 [Aspergillus heteromorphus CBS 117.55]|uniref:Uncharacterized protein n=1 Tax=Aspergillus heteromorphus CBS 117.55 TaxID=1448321 RepID=A0A317WNS6_9EURO|nr:uncharacterized protein BO70DRAFT_394725 [Aspergillus heteromorphus CBS 117.55]PWY86707.1 hypothetical protein BO70DRAFT_394725 [Aspergillus heteromorphus CBS 117.55]
MNTKVAADESTEPDKDSWKGSFAIPENQEEWNLLQKAGKLTKTTINTLSKMASGSKVFRKQFVTFRAIWPFPLETTKLLDFKADYGLHTTWERAEQIAHSSVELAKYLQLVSSKTPSGTLTEADPRWAGSFMSVLRYQEDCLDEVPGTSTGRTRKRATRHRIPWMARSEQADDNMTEYQATDEAIVNSALLLYLEAVTALAGTLSVKWTIRRLTFSPYFSAGRFRTVTDGAMVDKFGDLPHALVEVKKNSLAHTEESRIAIPMQITAEIVGLLRKHDTTCFLEGHHLMVSQFANEIFLMFAKAPTSYKGYLDVGVVNPNDFLVIQKYSPWRVNNEEDMQCLATVIISVFRWTLQHMVGCLKVD